MVVYHQIWCCASSYQPVSRRDGESISLVPYPAAPSQSDQHALYRDMESRWAVNPKVRRGDHTFLMVSDFLTNPGFPADSCSVWVASGRMLVDIIVSHRWITEFTGNGSNGERWLLLHNYWIKSLEKGGLIANPCVKGFTSTMAN